MGDAKEPPQYGEAMDPAVMVKLIKDQNPARPLSPEIQKILDSVVLAGGSKVSGLFPPKVIDPETLEFLRTGELPVHAPSENGFIPEHRHIWIHPRLRYIAYRENIDAPSERIDIEPDEEIT